MKVSKGFILREIAGSYVVVPVGGSMVDFSSMITTNETGAFLWKLLENGASEPELLEALLSEYEGVTKEEAAKDISDFIAALKEKNILE